MVARARVPVPIEIRESREPGMKAEAPACVCSVAREPVWPDLAPAREIEGPWFLFEASQRGFERMLGRRLTRPTAVLEIHGRTGSIYVFCKYWTCRAIQPLWCEVRRLVSSPLRDRFL
jgi:hypothetical protein